MSIVLFRITRETTDRDASPAGSEVDFSMKESHLTYRALVAAMAEDYKHASDNATSQRLRNLRSALQLWLACHGLPDDSVVGAELLGEFDTNLHHFLSWITERNVTAQTIKDRKSHLRRWRELAEKLSMRRQIESGDGKPFTRLLRSLVEEQGRPPKTIAKAAGVDHVTFYRWLSGATPNIRARASLHRIEEHFGLARGALSDMVRWSDDNNTASAVAPISIAYRERLKAVSRQPFLLKDVPTSLVNEWSALLHYKTSPFTFGLKRSPRGVWRLRPIEDLAPKYAHWSSLASPGKVAVTAHLCWNLTSSFFGWMTLSKDKGGLGYPRESMTLAWFAVNDAVSAYLAWYLARSGHIMHRGLTVFVQFAMSLLHPTTGYLSQQDKFATALPYQSRPKSWLAACRETYTALREFKQVLAQQARHSRDPFEPIQHILAAEQPMCHIVALIQAMRMDRARFTPGSSAEAAHMRDLLLICLLAANPLRANQFAMMRYKGDNTGNLYRTEDGNWWLRYEPQDFKNERGAARNRSYRMQVPEELNELIEDYIAAYRPRLIKTSSDYVFISSSSGQQGRPWARLNRVVEKLTRRYIAGNPGFGPHAFRHIVATHWLKTHPQDYPTVATMLHDALETVLRHYGHLQVEDGFRPYRSHFSQLLTKTSY